MKKNQIIPHYERHLAAFHEHFNNTQQRQKMEDIHQMRVSVKKLRAIWSLIEIVSHGKWKKKAHYALFRRLYQAAGKLRETQVNLKMAKQFKVAYLRPYIEYLERSEKVFSKNLALRMPKFDKEEFEILNSKLIKKMANMTDELVVQEAIAFVVKKSKIVQKLRDQPHDDEKLHKIRIHLKAVNQILTIIKELGTSKVLSSIQGQVKLLNSHIGKWHDYYELQESIKRFLPQSTGKKNTRLMNKLIERIENKQIERQEKIYQRIDKYLAKQKLVQTEVV